MCLFFKNWLIQLQSLACPKFAEGTDNLETQAALMQQFKSLGLPLWNPSCWGKCQSFALFRGSAEWMKPTHIMEGNLLYSKSTDLNVNFIQNTLTKTLRIMFNQIFWYLVFLPVWHIKLTIRAPLSKIKLSGMYGSISRPSNLIHWPTCLFQFYDCNLA